MSSQGEAEHEGPDVAAESYPQEYSGADGERGGEHVERNDRKPKGAGRNRGKGQGGKHGGGHGGSGNWHSGGRSQHDGNKRPLILGEAPQVRLKEASHLKGAAEHCILCWEEQPSYVSIGRCRHAEVCWVCTLRLRFLNQDTRCPLCNEELGEVLLTNDTTASVDPNDLIGLNHERPWIYFADDIIRRAVLSLLGYRCQIERCKQKDTAFQTLRQLEDHLWFSHWRQLCSVCLHDRPAFICEQRVYASTDIDRHHREGDSANLMEQRAMPTVPAHPRCQFCKQRFFNEEGLLAHMYRRHVVCQLCDSLGQKNEFYLNLKCLSRHYQERHYVCAHKDCEHGGYRQTAFAEERALIEHYEKVHKQSFKDDKGRTKLSMGFIEEDSRRRKGSGRGSGSTTDVDHVQFRWPSNLEPEDYTTEAAGSEDRGNNQYYNRYPKRDIVPLYTEKGGNWRVANKAEGENPEAGEAGEAGETPEDENEGGGDGRARGDATAEEAELLPELEKLSIDCAFGAEGRNGAPSCLSALHAALGALVTENEAEIEGWDIKLLPAVRRLNRTEVETLECMRIYLHDHDSKEDEQNGDSIDWEPLERILGLRPALRRLLHVDKVKPPTNARSRQAIGPRQGQTEVEEQDDEKGWREWKQLAQVRIQALAPKAQQRLLRYVELCVQRRTALEQLGEGVPDWEDEDIEQAFPSLSQSASGNAVPSTQPAEMNSLARHARGWADMAAGHTRAVTNVEEQFPALGGGTSTAARPSWGPQRNAPAPKESADNGGQGAVEAPKSDVLEKEAFPSLGGKTTAAPENVKWGAPNGTKDVPSDPPDGAASSSKREMTLEEWAKPKAPQVEKKDLNFSSAEAFPSLGGSSGSSASRAAPAPSWGARSAGLQAAKANSAKEAKEAKAVAAAKEAAEAIAEAKALRANAAAVGKKVETELANDANNFPELPSNKSSASKDVQPKKASKAAAKPTPKAAEKPTSSKVPKEEAPKAALAETMPIHLDQDLVLLKKSDDEEHTQAKEGSQKKKKGQQNKKNWHRCSEPAEFDGLRVAGQPSKPKP
eukprot:s699_g3.t5